MIMPSIKLLSHEKLIYRSNPHVIFLLGPMAGLLFFLMILWLGSCPALALFPLESFCHPFSTLAILFSIAVIYLDWHFNRLHLTNYRVIKERGIIGKRYTSIWLVKIQDLSCQFGFWGRLFNFGDLIIESAGRFGQMDFKGFPSPLKIKKLIGREINRL